MNKKELLIISCLRGNARETLTNLSKQTKMPISTVFEKLKANFNGLIKRHVTLIDFKLLGYTIKAHILLSVQKQHRPLLKEFLLKQFQVNSLSKVNNDFDFLIEGVFKDIKDVEDFVEHLEDRFPVERKQIHYIIEDLKEEAFLADPSLVNLLEPVLGSP